MSDLEVYRGSRVQRGFGLGTALFSIIKRIIPFVSRVARSRAVRSGAKYVGRKIGKAGVGVLEDVVMNKQDFKQSVRKRARSTGEEMLKDGVKFAKRKMRGRGKYQKTAFERATTSRLKHTKGRGSKKKNKRKRSLKRPIFS